MISFDDILCWEFIENMARIVSLSVKCLLTRLCTLDGTRSCSQIRTRLPEMWFLQSAVLSDSDVKVFDSNTVSYLQLAVLSDSDVKDSLTPGHCREPPYGRCRKGRLEGRWGFEG